MTGVTGADSNKSARIADTQVAHKALVADGRQLIISLLGTNANKKPPSLRLPIEALEGLNDTLQSCLVDSNLRGGFAPILLWNGYTMH